MHDRERLAQAYFDRGCGSPTPSIAARLGAPSARRRSSILTAPCASGARRWCWAPTSTCRSRKSGRAGLRRRREGAPLSPKASRAAGADRPFATRYAKDAKADRAPLDAGYASAMEKVAAQFPDNNEIAVFYAESVIDLSPSNYGSPGAGAQPAASPWCRHPDACCARTRTMRERSTPISMRWKLGPAGARRALSDRLHGAISGSRHLVPMRATSTTGRRSLDALADNETAAEVNEKYLAATNAPMGCIASEITRTTSFRLASAQIAATGPRSSGRRAAARPHPRRGRPRHRAGAAGGGCAHLAHALRSPPATHRAARSRRRVRPSRRCGAARGVATWPRTI